MKRYTPQRASSGFALTEALVALLLLAIAMLGAGASLIESLAGQRAALLQTQAADLAGNLAEALRSLPDGTSEAAEIENWRATVQRQLPQAEPVALPLDASPRLATDLPVGFDIRLRWRDGRRAPTQLTLPLGFHAPAGS